MQVVNPKGLSNYMQKRRSYTGTHIPVPENILNRIEWKLDMLDKALDEWVNERQACELLGIKRNTLGNYVSNGTIRPDAYSVGIGNNKFFNKKKLMGLR